jgi:hypothetical protein
MDFNKPKTWGGYDTTNLIQFIAKKDFSEIITERDNNWVEKYAKFNEEKFYFYGMKTSEGIEKMIATKKLY